MIEIKNFCKSYGNKTVYENFNLSLNEGEVTCILGASGSGKTTLLNVVAGLTAFGGSITKRKCSYVFQSPRLVPNLTVYDNLKLVCADGEKITAMLKAVELEEYAKSYPLKLSGGQAQRVSLARAFLYESDVILMDEPFSSLDIKLKKQMAELFFGLWQNDKKTALFVTHGVEEAVCLGHRVIVIDGGKIIYDERLAGVPPREEKAIDSIKAEIVKTLID